MSGKKQAPGKKAVKGAAGRKSARPMSQNVTTESNWSEQKERAALLVAQDALTDELIAAEVDIDRRTLARWKNDSVFSRRVGAIVAELREKIVARGIAERQNRVDALNDRWKRMQKVIEGRAVEYAGYKGGGATGLLVRQLKSIGKGEDAQTVEEYAVDTALLRELREHEKQAAQELGQWAEKHEHTGRDGGPIETRLILPKADAGS